MKSFAQKSFLVTSTILLLMSSQCFGQFQNWNNQIFDTKTSAPLNHDIHAAEQQNLPKFISKNILQMAHDIGAYIIRESTDQTQVFSPLSIYGALSMLLLGANGPTFNELMKFMHYTEYSNNDLSTNSWKIHKEFGKLLKLLDHEQQTDDCDVEHKIRVANRVFVQNGYTIRSDFSDAIRSVYESNTTNLDFIRNGPEATAYINNWVNMVTEGKIPEIISDTISPETKLVVTSAIHFKAIWEKTFIEGGTTKRNFYPDGLDNPSISVDMMAQGGTFPFYNAIEYDCRIIGLPYKRNESTMYIILPNNSSRTRLRELQLMLSADNIREMISKMEPKTTVMLFPKLHISNHFNLKMVLRQLGVYRLFDQTSSDLSLISNGIEYPYNYVMPDLVEPQAASMLNWKLTSITNEPNFNLEETLIFSRISEDVDNVDKNSTATPNATQTRSMRHRQKRSLHSLQNLDKLRREFTNTIHKNPGLFAEEIIHKIDLTVNEKGTDGGAATVTYLYRSGTDVIFRVETPFMFLIQHDVTQLPLFYGTVYEPTNF